MQMLLRLGLVWLIVLTSLSLGMVRGQLRTGTEVILCSGSAVIVDPDHPQGVRYCPDMAASMLLMLDPPPVIARRDAQLSRRAELPAAPRRVALMHPVPQARAPPPLQVA